MRNLFLLLLLQVMVARVAYTQNYYAINGSSYAGSLGTGNNPASIVNTPFAWDINLFSIQAKNSTNAVTIINYSLLTSPANSQYLYTGGDYRRFAYLNYNINLLNTRFAINRKKAFGFGLNMRGYTNSKTSPYNFIDTVGTIREFYNLGNYTRTLSADVISSNWLEFYGTYSQTIWDNIIDRLNAGITLKVTRALAGVHGNIKDVRFERNVQNNPPVYLSENATAQYGYSANLDTWQSGNPIANNMKDVFTNAKGGYSIDMGVEYLIKSKVVPTFYDDEETYYDYEWKIGLSVLDLGLNNYRYGVNSRREIRIQENIADSTIDGKFEVSSFSEFNDSLETITKTMGNLRGPFTITNPARIVLNVDRYISGNFFINGDLTLNLSGLSKNNLQVKEMNLLTITPRWETKRMGFYLPAHYDTEGKVWIGGAFKLGPLLFGIHNWANIFSKKKMNNSGGYFAIVIRSNKLPKKYVDKRYDCPDF